MSITSMSFEVKESECFYNLEKIFPTPSVIRANMPKLMPFIDKAKPKTSKVQLDNSIYCNNASCKPKVNGSIQTQNFITLKKHPHEQLDFSIDLDTVPDQYGNYTMIDKFHKFTADVEHGDIRQMYISTK